MDEEYTPEKYEVLDFSTFFKDHTEPPTQEELDLQETLRKPRDHHNPHKVPEQNPIKKYMTKKFGRERAYLDGGDFPGKIFPADRKQFAEDHEFEDTKQRLTVDELRE